MEREKEKFTKLRIKLAEDKLKVANHLFEHKHYKEVVSACYYAMFYAVKALLLAEGRKDPHTHEGVKILFGKYCIEQGRMDKSYGKIFAVAQEARYRADYKEMIVVSKKEAQESVKETGKFIKVLKSRVRAVIDK